MCHSHSRETSSQVIRNGNRRDDADAHRAPPAGSNPVIVYLAQPDWSFLLFPTLVGALVIAAVALIYNNATREAAYPKYW